MVHLRDIFADSDSIDVETEWIVHRWDTVVCINSYSCYFYDIMIIMKVENLDRLIDNDYHWEVYVTEMLW